MSKYLARKNKNSMDVADLDQPDSTTNNPPNNKYTYDLFAVCNHKGQNMANGHYTGKIRPVINFNQFKIYKFVLYLF